MSSSTVEEDLLEVSDLVVQYDSKSLARVPVAWRPVEAYYRERSQRQALAVVRALPKAGDYFDPAGVDQTLLMAHMELQRLEEEILHGHRVLDLVRALISACESSGVSRPFRIADIGCGLGYVVRWLTAFGGLGPDVELIGVDYNEIFVRAATKLAEQEGLRCAFTVGNAFQLDRPATIYLSSGVLHHFRGSHLMDFFAGQAKPNTAGFIHTDIRPSPLSPVGAWIYHRARMREPLALHDGPLSAKRAHSAAVLLEASRSACPEFVTTLHTGGPVPWVDVFQSVVGLRPSLQPCFAESLARAGLTEFA